MIQLKNEILRLTLNNFPKKDTAITFLVKKTYLYIILFYLTCRCYVYIFKIWTKNTKIQPQNTIKQKGCLLPTCSFPLQKKGNYFILTLDRLSDLPHAHCISTTLLLTAYLYQSHWIKRMSDFFRYVYTYAAGAFAKSPFIRPTKKNLRIYRMQLVDQLGAALRDALGRLLLFGTFNLNQQNAGNVYIICSYRHACYSKRTNNRL